MMNFKTLAFFVVLNIDRDVVGFEDLQKVWVILF